MRYYTVYKGVGIFTKRDKARYKAHNITFDEATQRYVFDESAMLDLKTISISVNGMHPDQTIFMDGVDDVLLPIERENSSFNDLIKLLGIDTLTVSDKYLKIVFKYIELAHKFGIPCYVFAKVKKITKRRMVKISFSAMFEVKYEAGTTIKPPDWVDYDSYEGSDIDVSDDTYANINNTSISPRDFELGSLTYAQAPVFKGKRYVTYDRDSGECLLVKANGSTEEIDFGNDSSNLKYYHILNEY